MHDLQHDLRAYFDELATQAERAVAERSPAMGRRSRLPRSVLVAACLVVVLGVVGLVVVIRGRGGDPQGVVTTPDVEVGAIEGVWRDLPTTGLGPDPHAVLLRTDDGLLTIYPEHGGEDVVGELFRPRDGTRQAIAPSGLEWRAFPAIVWTGTKAIVAGGSNGPGITHAAAAYSPSTDTWRALPDPPGFENGSSDNQVGPAVWTGTAMVSWQSNLSFDPATERWNELAPAPLSPRTDEAVTAAGSRVFVWGGCTPPPDDQCDEALNDDELRDGATYDAATDTWTTLPASPLGAGDDPVAVWTGTEVIVTVNVPADPAAPSAAAYDPSRGTWRVLPASHTPGHAAPPRSGPAA